MSSSAHPCRPAQLPFWLFCHCFWLHPQLWPGASCFNGRALPSSGPLWLLISMSPGSILSWFADCRYAHISIWSKTGLQEVKPFAISFGQRSCDVKLPKRVSSRHVVCGSNIAGGSGWGSLISAGIAVIRWGLTIAVASHIRESSSSWVSSYNPNSKSMASTMYQMVPICLPATPPKRDAWGDWITTHILTHIITLPLTLHPSQSLYRVATPVHLRCKAWPLMVKKCLKARKILVCSTAVLLHWHAMLLPTNSSSYKVWIEIKYDLQIACFHATVSTVLSFTERVPIKPIL